jgi:hypothetical protein
MKKCPAGTDFALSGKNAVLAGVLATNASGGLFLGLFWSEQLFWKLFTAYL